MWGGISRLLEAGVGRWEGRGRMVLAGLGGGDGEDGAGVQVSVDQEVLRYQVGNGGEVRGFRMVRRALEVVAAMEEGEVEIGGEGKGALV
jgi:hypothetical protein